MELENHWELVAPSKIVIDEERLKKRLTRPGQSRAAVVVGDILQMGSNLTTYWMVTIIRHEEVEIRRIRHSGEGSPCAIAGSISSV